MFQLLEFFHQLNIASCCRTTLYTYQRLYVNPLVHLFWVQMQTSLLDKFKNEGAPLKLTGIA
jgi:hypothetical protein